jgi:hypothetical protein
VAASAPATLLATRRCPAPAWGNIFQRTPGFSPDKVLVISRSK